MTVDELDAFGAAMLRRKIAAVKFDGIEIHLSPTAFMPDHALPSSASFVPAAPPKADESPEVIAPWMAFRRELKTEPTAPPEPGRPTDPSDPNGQLDDSLLFGSDLPQN